MGEHEILTIEEVAQYLRISERTAYDWANKGTIPCGKLGTTWRFKRSEIERWVDDKLSGKRTHSPGDTQTIKLQDVLSPDRVLLLDTRSKSEVLDALIECLSRTPDVKDAKLLREEIFHREELMSTGIGFSVAVPHVRIDSVTNLVVAVAISKHQIADYESLDEKPVRIICMVAARTDQHAQYLKTLGLVSSILKAESVRDALLEAPDPQTAFLILTQ